MATLEYALLAEYVRIDSAGLFTIVGGSFDRVQVDSLDGSLQQIFVALRMRIGADEDPVPFEVRVQAPDNQYEIGVTGVASQPEDGEPVDGAFGFSSAIGLGVPLPSVGRYVVQVTLAGEIVRELPFVVATTRSAGN